MGVARHCLCCIGYMSGSGKGNFNGNSVSFQNRYQIKVAVMSNGMSCLMSHVTHVPVYLHTPSSLQCGKVFVEVFRGPQKQHRLNHKFLPLTSAHFRLRALNTIGWRCVCEGACVYVRGHV